MENLIPTLKAEKDALFDKWVKFMAAAIAVSIGLAIVSAVAACFIPPGCGTLTAVLATTAGRVAVGAAVGSVTAAATLGSQSKSARDEYEDKCNEYTKAQIDLATVNDNLSTFDVMTNTLLAIKPKIEVMKNSIQQTEQLWRSIELQNNLILDKFGKAVDRSGIAFRRTISSALPLFQILVEVMGVYITSFAADPGVVNEPTNPGT